MPQDGSINLDKVKAKYSVKDITFVDIREINLANEQRLSSEIGFGIGLPVLSSLINNFSMPLLLTGLAFLAFGFFSLYRYITRKKEIEKDSSACVEIDDEGWEDVDDGEEDKSGEGWQNIP